MKIESNVFTASADTNSKWDLNAGTGTRFYDERINFNGAFPKIPTLVLGITEFDVLNSSNARLKVFPVDIDQGGFTIRVKTWANSLIWSVEVQWLALER